MKRILLLGISALVILGLLVVPACGGTTPDPDPDPDPDPVEYTLTMAVSPGDSGTTTPAVGTHQVTEGTEVSIDASATGDYEFINWSASPVVTFGLGVNEPEGNSFTMPSSNVVITANFLLPVVYTFTDDQLKIGIAGEVGHPTGDMAWLGANLALGMGSGTVTIGDKTLTVVLSKIDTKEASDESGEEGTLEMLDKIGGVDVVMGGFRTEAVEVYREVAMSNNKLFFNCGAATESLQRSAATDYTTYRYWFKTTPPNEYFLASSVLRIIDAVAAEIRAELGLAADAELRSVIISEDLKWARDEQVPVYEAGLAALNIDNKQTFLVSALDPAGTSGIMPTVAGHNPHIIIPLYSGNMGVVYAMALDGFIDGGIMAPMSVGINVMAQLNQPWAAKLFNPYGAGHPECAHSIILDTWATGLSQTALSQPFLTAFQGFTGGEYPLYTAATFDAIKALKAALEEVGYVDGGVAKAKADDIIAFYENPANVVPSTTAEAHAWYPQPGTTSGGKPALSQAQVEAIYPIATYGYTYNAADWQMPPHTTHDLAYGPGRATGLGAQWQWHETPGVWLKVGVWPKEFGEPKVDQYGDWDYQFDGTAPIVIPDYFTSFHSAP
ncbi:MAG: hypothetical protein R6V51_03930 [Dehalococcoidia bacterium]